MNNFGVVKREVKRDFQEKKNTVSLFFGWAGNLSYNNTLACIHGNKTISCISTFQPMWKTCFWTRTVTSCDKPTFQVFVQARDRLGTKTDYFYLGHARRVDSTTLVFTAHLSHHARILTHLTHRRLAC